MAGARRPLKAGLKPVDPTIEKRFVFGPKAETHPPVNESPSPREGKGKPKPRLVRVTTRLSADYVAILKRASLERQLAGQEPNTLQDMIEEALEPWLRTNGYLK